MDCNPDSITDQHWNTDQQCLCDVAVCLPCVWRGLILPKEYQVAMIAEQSKSGNVFTVYHTSAGHSAHLTITEPLATMIAEFAEKIKPT